MRQYFNNKMKIGEDIMNVKYSCREDKLIKYEYPDVIEFDTYNCFEKMQEFCRSFNCEVNREEWFNGKTQDENWIDYVIIIDNRIVSRSSVWKYSEDKWEVAAVHTLPEFRGKGYGTQVVSCCSDYIISNRKTATCTTDEANIPMRKLAEKIGFKLI